MKYGVLVIKDTKNIGDDIQSYAASKFLPKIDYYIEREELDTFVSEKKEEVAVIMSHWFLHNKINFPPSPYINPLFISTHFTDNLEDKCPRYLKGYSAEYLKKYEPLGLRDSLVKKHLEKQGIETYFSGCMTLTLREFKNIKKEDYVCAVDISKELVNKIKLSMNCEIKEMTHTVETEKNSQLSYKDRFDNVENLLKTYQKARCVITTRLHCALPCLAIGVPVMLIYDEKDKDVRNRLGEYLKLCHHIKSSDSLDNSDKIINFIKKSSKNSDNYLKYRKKLEKKVKKFITDVSLKDEKIITDSDYIECFCKSRMEDLKQQVQENIKINTELNNDIEKLKEEKLRLEKLIKERDLELDKIYKSKMYKINSKLRKIIFWNS